MQRAFRKRGIKALLGTRFESAKVGKDAVEINYKDSEGKEGKLTAETFLVAVGRRPFTQGLGLETRRSKSERGFLKVDEYMRTAEPNVYAIGDVVPTPGLAHLAAKEGCVAAEHIAGKNPQPINYNHVPNCTYCDPEIAASV